MNHHKNKKKRQAIASANILKRDSICIILEPPFINLEDYLYYNAISSPYLIDTMEQRFSIFVV